LAPLYDLPMGTVCVSVCVYVYACVCVCSALGMLYSRMPSFVCVCVFLIRIVPDVIYMFDRYIIVSRLSVGGASQ